MSTDQKEVTIWTLKEGRDKQWISKGPWIGRGKEIDVVPKSDYDAIRAKVKALSPISTDPGFSFANLRKILSIRYGLLIYPDGVKHEAHFVTAEDVHYLVESKDAEIVALREALEYYAKETNWTHGDVPGHSYIMDSDKGFTARKSLKRDSEPKSKDASNVLDLNVCHLCKGLLWVCENHPDHPWNKDCCKGAGVPCKCNKEGEDPRDFIRIEEI